MSNKTVRELASKVTALFEQTIEDNQDHVCRILAKYGSFRPAIWITTYGRDGNKRTGCYVELWGGDLEQGHFRVSIEELARVLARDGTWEDEEMQLAIRGFDRARKILVSSYNKHRDPESAPIA